jgi:4-amino-4-deoxy-L-arabinose transferase-like glycosyltransferase
VGTATTSVADHAVDADNQGDGDPSAGRPPGFGPALRARLRGLDRYDGLLALIVLGGLILRVVYAVANQTTPVSGDGIDYYGAALLLGDGRGFVSATLVRASGGFFTVQAAEHPPAWALTLTPLALAGVERLLWFQIAASAVGSATVGVVGLTARRLAGPRCGLIAAAIAALYPNLWIYERVLQCETLAMLLTALCLYVAYGLWQRPDRRGVIILGLLVGALTMTRPEALLLYPLLVVPLVLRLRPLDRATRLRWLAIGTAMVLLPVLPWVVYNTSRFDQPVGLTTNIGTTLAAANCDEVYDGPMVGWWSYQCLADATGAAQQDMDVYGAAELDAGMRDLAVEYMGDHLDRLPAVMLFREGRTWGIYAPNQQTRLDSIGGPKQDVTRYGLWAYWALAPAAIAGAVILRRRRIPLTPVLAVIATVAISTGLTIGQTRYRALAEIPIVILAAIALDALFRRRDTPAGDGEQPREDQPGATEPAATGAGIRPS